MTNKETTDWKENMPYKIGFSEGFIDGFKKGKQQATKELLEEISKIFNKEDKDTIWSSAVVYFEIKQILSKLGEERK
jgi:hypothetical protein